MSVALEVIAPIILLLLLGKFLAQRQLISDSFVFDANKLAYNVTLPILLFTAISQADITRLFNGPMMLSGFVGTTLAFAFFAIATQWLNVRHYQRGVVIQGAFRANMGIIGLAVCQRFFGESGLALASVYLGFVVPMFNLLAVWVLVLFSNRRRRKRAIALEVFKSPLVIAVMVALPFSLFDISLPNVILDACQLIAQVTLPLALLCIGGSLKMRKLAGRVQPLSLIVIGKMVIYPAIVGVVAWFFNVQQQAWTVLLLLSFAPTATASFPAVQQLGGDAELAGDAVAITTLLSLPLYILLIQLLN